MKLINASKRDRTIPFEYEMKTLPPGGEVEITEEELDQLRRYPSIRDGLHAGHFEIKGGKADPEKETVKPTEPIRPGPELPEGVTGEGIERHHVGGGWYRVFVNGIEVTDGNVRKDRLDEILAEYE